MRGFRLLITVLIISPILMLALSDSRLSRQPFAQVTAAPGPVPLTAPVAPGQPQAFSTIGALPSLAAAPGTLQAAASAAPTPRSFRCSCASAGEWTEWVGIISSSSYFLADQSAKTQCANYILNAHAPSPYTTPEGQTTTQQRPQIYNGEAFTTRSQIATSVGESYLSQRSQEALLQTQCTQCACN
ncbi:MAG: hypothetical protein ABSD30_19400 [Candidatus Binatus sp.]|jgi:hypothetical protein